jgi:hypothetical protein
MSMNIVQTLFLNKYIAFLKTEVTLALAKNII